MSKNSQTILTAAAVIALGTDCVTVQADSPVTPAGGAQSQSGFVGINTISFPGWLPYQATLSYAST